MNFYNFACRKPPDLLLLRIKRSLLEATFQVVGFQGAQYLQEKKRCKNMRLYFTCVGRQLMADAGEREKEEQRIDQSCRGEARSYVIYASNIIYA